MEVLVKSLSVQDKTMKSISLTGSGSGQEDGSNVNKAE
jgi:hypothetical protein